MSITSTIQILHSRISIREITPSTVILLSFDILKGDINGTLNIYSLKSDLSKSLKNNWKIETGIKTSFVKADNDMQFFDATSGVSIVDQNKTNHFIYEENINALYGNVSKKWNKFSAIFGLRAENTNVTGNQLTTNQVNKKNYTKIVSECRFFL
ncbi:outer membrane beta-barrel protein [Chryseobacterium indoltheticum]|uniref:outer membrane beta-barrel protein n=1 Tax=Chryseobacterium indoltheticum TaxID=254 RepID=UPI003F493A7F